MKRSMMILLAIAVLLSFAACGKEEEPTEVITETPVSVTEPTAVFPTGAKVLTSIPAFNGHKADFAYADGVFYVSLTDEANNQQNTLQLTLPAVITDTALTAEGILLMSDMDFDGDTDIGLLYNIKSANRQYYCYLWNAQTKTLTFNSQLSDLYSPTFDKTAKLITAVVTENGNNKKVTYKWNNQILTQVKTEENTTEPTTTSKLSAEAVADAVWSLYAVDIDKIKSVDTDSVNGNTVTVFEVSISDGTVHIAADAGGNIYIDEDCDGYYQNVDYKDGRYYIGASLNSGYDSDDYIDFAKEIAAMEVGEDNTGSAQRNGTDYVDGRLVLVYKVSVYDDAGSITVAFDDTMTYYYLLSSSGDYNTPEEKTTEDEPTERPTDEPTETPTTEIEIIYPDEIE